MKEYYYCVVDEEHKRYLRENANGFVEATSIHVALYRIGQEIEKDKALTRAVRNGKATLTITFKRRAI